MNYLNDILKIRCNPFSPSGLAEDRPYKKELDIFWWPSSLGGRVEFDRKIHRRIIEPTTRIWLLKCRPGHGKTHTLEYIQRYIEKHPSIYSLKVNLSEIEEGVSDRIFRIKAEDILNTSIDRCLESSIDSPSQSFVVAKKLKFQSAYIDIIDAIIKGRKGDTDAVNFLNAPERVLEKLDVVFALLRVTNYDKVILLVDQFEDLHTVLGDKIPKFLAGLREVIQRFENFVIVLGADEVAIDIIERDYNSLLDRAIDLHDALKATDIPEIKDPFLLEDFIKEYINRASVASETDSPLRFRHPSDAGLLIKFFEALTEMENGECRARNASFIMHSLVNHLCKLEPAREKISEEIMKYLNDESWARSDDKNLTSHENKPDALLKKRKNEYLPIISFLAELPLLSRMTQVEFEVDFALSNPAENYYRLDFYERDEETKRWRKRKSVDIILIDELNFYMFKDIISISDLLNEKVIIYDENLSGKMKNEITSKKNVTSLTINEVKKWLETLNKDLSQTEKALQFFTQFVR